MNMWDKRTPKYKEQLDNPLTKKWGYADKRATASLGETRRNLLRLVHSIWEQLNEPTRAYWKDVLDFEQVWHAGKCKDWRLFWNQPKSVGSQEEEFKLDGWWHRPLESFDRAPTEQGESQSPPAPVPISDIIKSVFPNATIPDMPLEAQFKKGGRRVLY